MQEEWEKWQKTQTAVSLGRIEYGDMSDEDWTRYFSYQNEHWTKYMVTQTWLTGEAKETLLALREEDASLYQAYYAELEHRTYAGIPTATAAVKNDGGEEEEEEEEEEESEKGKADGEKGEGEEKKDDESTAARSGVSGALLGGVVAGVGAVIAVL
jgi:hypothetical protein